MDSDVNQPVENSEKLLRPKEISNEEKELELIKYKFQTDTQEVLNKYEKTLRELSAYKWGLRVFFTVLLGGSVLGFLKYQEYLDGRIADRIVRLDSFSYAVSLQRSGNYRKALIELENLADFLKKSGYQSTSEFKKSYYFNILTTLANMFELDGDADFVGKISWDRLSKNEEFTRLFILGMEYSKDDQVQNSLGLCTLKYDDSRKAAKKARSYFEKAYKLTDSSESKAAQRYDLAMLDIIARNETSAAKNFKEAAELYPRNYALDTLVLDDAAMNGGEFMMFVIASNRAGNHNFRNIYKKVVGNLNADIKS
jgi:tetratricopeptide (TPR) repeat protein